MRHDGDGDTPMSEETPEPPAQPAPESAASKTGERLHKFLASTGAGSRRECEEIILDARVSVNGRVVSSLPVLVDLGEAESERAPLERAHLRR